MPKPSEGKLLYHMTRLENMPSILKYGLLSRTQVEQFGLLSKDIADPEILAGRENVLSPRPLPDYVPFHFFVKNPFDGKVCNRYGSENMVIIAIKRIWAERIESSHILTAHPLNYVAPPEIYPYKQGMERIDWHILDLPYGQRDYHNEEIKQKCMAECLIPDGIAPENFAYVYVHNPAAKEQIEKMPYFSRLKYPISVNPHMFP